MLFIMLANGWYMLSGRISESVPVRRTRNCDARIRSWRTTKPRPAICTLLCLVFYSLIFIFNHKFFRFLYCFWITYIIVFTSLIKF